MRSSCNMVVESLDVVHCPLWLRLTRWSQQKRSRCDSQEGTAAQGADAWSAVCLHSTTCIQLP